MAHRYWRLVWPLGGDIGRNFLGPIAEIELRGSIGGADLTGSGTATASFTSAGSAANAFDNSSGTSWESNTSNESVWISYDFGSAVDVAEVFLSATSSTTGSTARRGICFLEYSDNNTTWTRLAPMVDTSGLHTSATVTANGFVPIAAPRLLPKLRLPSTAVTGGLVPRFLGELRRWDYYDSGNYKIEGTVAIDDTPVDVPAYRRVRLFEKITGRLIRQVWSNPSTGAYKFEKIKNVTYFAVADDYTHEYDAVVHDELTPEVMT